MFSRGFLGKRAEALASGGEFDQERRRPVTLIAGLVGELGQPVADIGQSDRVGIEHWPATPGREAIAVNTDHVDIAGPQRYALLENPGALVDHREDQPFGDLLA